ncbi:MAG TPA: TolC family protein [Bacteroidales bacterium]|jgi:outer membrane protein|nr:TolC family protein [Bacteroidales bacterium]
MNRFIRGVLLIIAVLWIPVAKAQESLSLDACIQYALENNLAIKKQNLNIEQSTIRYNQAKNEMYPTLSAGGGYNFIFARTRNTENDSWESHDNVDASLGLTSNFTLFAGFRNNHMVHMNEFNLLGSKAAYDQLELETAISVTLAYLKILFYKEALASSNIQMQLIDLHMAEIRKMTEIGAKSNLELLDFEAQKALEVQKKVEIESHLRLARLELIQIIDMDSLIHVEVEEPTPLEAFYISIPSPDSVYRIALNQMPSVISADYRVKGAQKALSLAKADRYPVLSLRSAYYSRFNRMTGNSLQYDPINPSLDYPYPQSSGNDQIVILNLYLTSSLFNKKQIESNIDQARVGLMESRLSQEMVKQNLKKEIQQICMEALNAVEKFNASETSLKAFEESFNFVRERQLNGSASTLDFNESALKLENARIELLKAKYELLFKLKIIDLYMGVPVKL